MMGKILLWLQERIKHWTKPATSVLIIGILSDVTRSRADLMAENALLRQQLIVLNRQVNRPCLTNPDRFLETSPSHRSARHIVTLASWVVSILLATEIARQTQGFVRNDCIDSKDGERESIMGGRANPRRIIEFGDRSE